MMGKHLLTTPREQERGLRWRVLGSGVVKPFVLDVATGDGAGFDQARLGRKGYSDSAVLDGHDEHLPDVTLLVAVAVHGRAPGR